MVAQRVEDWDYNFPPSPAGAIPAEVIKTDRILDLNGSNLVLKYYGPAHTDGDISVRFTNQDIFHVGDTYWNGIYPFIDYSTGGSIDGMIAATNANLDATTDSTTIIPGHGQPISNRPELKDYSDMLTAIRGNIAELKKQGRSLEDTIAAKSTSRFDAKWGQFVIGPTFFTELVFNGV
jgi:glyoxylase-like metal-dependent hydrolase (beta-lactamase superfamily II)